MISLTEYLKTLKTIISMDLIFWYPKLTLKTTNDFHKVSKAKNSFVSVLLEFWQECVAFGRNMSSLISFYCMMTFPIRSEAGNCAKTKLWWKLDSSWFPISNILNCLFETCLDFWWFRRGFIGKNQFFSLRTCSRLKIL